ncbi:MAG: molybdopterin-synthase adenylyltransferase MoeB [Deltaproteobacteria bacterium]|nr:molybdopterin-synthase adenylyltransferase MoeB [Deltaproteobacteria bacterium]MBT6501434.1 molybdopterin-synthase adenylyltransferase MoeB [Deltaproteobacteria bacterium]MBT6616084.1 molybdopterin-synthase adenylyltransferase MoeB [Deltaproteobacteria bacterium]MBT7151043.1 molybdopterin-synthase adenylyltransferase MoeB [Deltaproteobacteria bacterium]MBT7713685.1 molybdopterin-synthase adenylyltransferase MoeB [Deltaproteobacteria bacterium]
MSAVILIPSPLRRFTDNRSCINTDANTVGDALNCLFDEFPNLRQQLIDENGQLRKFVNIFVNQDKVKNAGGLKTTLPDKCKMRITQVVTDSNSELMLPELTRYSRHLLLPEVGETGQKKLKAAKVLIIGAGGLGCPASLYLAAAGVGHLGIIDSDVVEESNLQRQILYNIDDIGISKVECAQEKLSRLNPYIEVKAYNVVLTSQNALGIIKNYDLVIDGTDNFPTRYLVNDACVLLGKPNCYGSIYRFEGQASLFSYKNGPCYRCLVPNPPPPELVSSCAEAGVFGVLPSIIGSIQATEAIKIITGIGKTLNGRFLTFDALGMDFHEFTIRRDDRCEICGDDPSIFELIDYQQFCRPESSKEAVISEISPIELKQKLERGDSITILDVREEFEIKISNLKNTVHIPMNSVEDRLEELNPQDELIIYCSVGLRSARICNLLKKKGFNNVLNLKGGINAWANDVDPDMTIY